MPSEHHVQEWLLRKQHAGFGAACLLMSKLFPRPPCSLGAVLVCQPRPWDTKFSCSSTSLEMACFVFYCFDTAMSCKLPELFFIAMCSVYACGYGKETMKIL